MKKEYKKIPLTGIYGEGLYTKVDKDVFEEATKHKWHVNRGYAERTYWDGERTAHQKLHHFVLGGIKKGNVTDHINGNKLDNRRENLRECEQRLNTYNRGVPKNSVSAYKGVSPAPRGRWEASIGYMGKTIHIGYFDKEKDAAKAYDYYADKYAGEFAVLNFPDRKTKKPTPRKYSSKYIGVSYDSRDRIYYTAFSHKGKRYRAGGYKCEKDALEALNQKKDEIIGVGKYIKETYDEGACRHCE